MVTLATALIRFSANADIIAALIRNVTAEQAAWKPSPEEWSILEVICHLYDEEREDFRTRLDFSLHRPAENWPPIEPQSWVTARGYNQRDLNERLEAFLQERQRSLGWLRSLQDPNWDSRHTDPHGSMTAGEVLGAWVAHDHLHIRQLNHLHWQWLAQSAAPRSLEYAGGW